MEKEKEWTLFGRLLDFWQGTEPQEGREEGIGFRQRAKGWMQKFLGTENAKREKSSVLDAEILMLPEQNGDAENPESRRFWREKIADAEAEQRTEIFSQEKKMLPEEIQIADAAGEEERERLKNREKKQGWLETNREVREVLKNDTMQDMKRTGRSAISAILPETGNSEMQPETKINFGMTFAKEPPEEAERGKRKIISVQEAAEKKEIPAAMAKQPELIQTEKEQLRTEEKRTEPTVDIDRLMRQFAQRLWEEREGCGRRRYR